MQYNIRIPLNRVAAWFIMRICPHAIYNDALRLLLKQFTLFDRAMMYEAVTGQSYGDPAHMWILALHEQPNIAPHLRNRFDNLQHALLMQLRTNAVATVIFSFARLHNLRMWVEDCAKCGFVEPFMYVLQHRTNIDNHYVNDQSINVVRSLASWAVDAKSLPCLQACYAIDATIVDHQRYYTCAQGTWLWLMQHGARLDARYDTKIMKCIAESPDNGMQLLKYLIQPLTISDIVGEAVGKGEMLDWIHKHATVDEMLSTDWQSSTLHVDSAKWFMSKGVPIALLHSFCYESVRYLYPIASLTDRAHMLANDTNVIYWYKCKLKRGRHNQVKYDRDLFMHLAGMKSIQEMRHIESKYAAIYTKILS